MPQNQGGTRASRPDASQLVYVSGASSDLTIGEPGSFHQDAARDVGGTRAQRGCYIVTAFCKAVKAGKLTSESHSRTNGSLGSPLRSLDLATPRGRTPLHPQRRVAQGSRAPGIVARRDRARRCTTTVSQPLHVED